MSDKMLKFTDVLQQNPPKREALNRRDDFNEIYSEYIYEKATHLIPNFKKSRTIAIGDSINHDILGAHDFGVKSILITSGIHKDLFKAKKSNIEDRISSVTERNIRPNYICERLIF